MYQGKFAFWSQIRYCHELNNLVKEPLTLTTLISEGLPDVLVDLLEKHQQSKELMQLVMPLLVLTAKQGSPHCAFLDPDGQGSGAQVVSGTLFCLHMAFNSCADSLQPPRASRDHSVPRV